MGVSSAQAAQFAALGVLRLPAVFSAAEVTELRAAMERLCAQSSAGRPDVGIMSGRLRSLSGARSCCRCWATSGSWGPCARCWATTWCGPAPRACGVREIRQQPLGVMVLTLLAVAGDAVEGLNSHHWHADGGSEGWADEPLPGRLKAFLYLDPTTRDGGALRVRSPRFPLPPT